MLGLLFSWFGISLTTVVLGGLAVVAFMRGWLHIAIGLAVAAFLFAYSGVFVQIGEGICEDRVRKAVEREQARQGKIIDDVVEGTRARADAAEEASEAKDREIAEYEKELTRRIAERGDGVDTCALDDADVQRLRSIAR